MYEFTEASTMVAEGSKYSHLNSSYFYDVDVVHGWGNRSFFTFFSEFNRTSPSLGRLEATIFFLLTVISLVGNIVVFVQLVLHRRNRGTTTCFICNLTIADLCFTGVAPFIAVTRITEKWVFGSEMCSLLVYMGSVCAFVDIWTMTLIGIDRYMCIVRRSRTRLTPRLSILILGVVWAFAFISFSPLAVYFNVRSVPMGTTKVDICTLVWPRQNKFKVSFLFTSVVCICGFILPLLLLSWSYFQIFRKFWNIRGVIIQNQRNLSSKWMNSLNVRRRRDIRDFKVVKTLFLLVLLFGIMWSPIFISMILILYDGAADTMIMSSQVFIATYCVAVCNACINPFVYGIMMERLRTKLTSCVTCSRSGSSDPEPEVSPDKHDSVQVISYGAETCAQNPLRDP
ncbi:free fatty acid receptor 4-like isoform X2 [Haliotis rufescens]|uniref:free fatty acid receptor 4-like isoform X2 n=1 Tax=Haliotis rufescens TaxID=6454 RepID=UPI001EB03C85|nr:free fatty acid receptor 4-like isoform X2 [Haliotis rufescens]